jgi:hypothetical protein
MKKFVLFFLLPLFSHAQVITTYAGGGASLGDGGTATAALINDPCEIMLIDNEVMYIASGVDNRIRKIDSNGIITTIAGTGAGGYSGDSGLATAAELKDPVGIAIDSNGNVFFSDAENSVIRKINISTGIITTICGTGTAGYNGDNIPATSAQLNIPDGICFDTYGNLFVADGENNRVRKIDTSGIITTVAGTGIYGYNGDNQLATSAKLFLPTDVTFDSGGNMYIADGTNRRVREVNTSGIITTFAGNGNATYSGDGMSAINAQLTAGFIKFDHWGNLYISDPYNYRVYRIDNAGIFHWVAGSGLAINSGDGGPAIAAGIYYPTGLAFDTCDNLYIGNVAASGDSDRIRKVLFNPACWPLEVPKTVANEKTIYPNPAYETINIDGVKTEENYSLINIYGIIEQSGTLKQGNNSIAIQSLPPGIHLLELTDNEGRKTVRKIVKD